MKPLLSHPPYIPLLPYVSPGPVLGPGTSSYQLGLFPFLPWPCPLPSSGCLGVLLWHQIGYKWARARDLVLFEGRASYREWNTIPSEPPFSFFILAMRPPLHVSQAPNPLSSASSLFAFEKATYFTSQWLTSTLSTAVLSSLS